MTSAAAPGNHPAPPPESGPTGDPESGPEPRPESASPPVVRPAPGGDGAPWRGWAAVCAVSLGIFCLITSELLPVGLLTPSGPPSASPTGPRA